MSNLAKIAQVLTPTEIAAGIGWYPMARRHSRRIARAHRSTEHRAAGVISALSPRCRWAQNLIRADDAFRTGTARGLFADKAQAILNGARPLDTLRGPKTRSFYRNITGNLQAVTIDTWALGAVLGTRDKRILHNTIERVGEYEAAADEYRSVASWFGLRPAEFQAAVWVHVRGSST